MDFLNEVSPEGSENGDAFRLRVLAAFRAAFPDAVDSKQKRVTEGVYAGQSGVTIKDAAMIASLTRLLQETAAGAFGDPRVALAMLHTTPVGIFVGQTSLSAFQAGALWAKGGLPAIPAE